MASKAAQSVRIPRRPSNRRCARCGFSLIELLVVVVIVGVIAFAVVLSVGGNGERRLRLEADRFAALVGAACDRAELSGREVGIAVDGDGYVFTMLSGTVWRPFPESSELRARRWPASLRATLAREGHDVDVAADGANTPDLVCYSSGELTPFTLTLALGEASRFRVRGNEDASIATERVGTEP